MDSIIDGASPQDPSIVSVTEGEYPLPPEKYDAGPPAPAPEPSLFEEVVDWIEHAEAKAMFEANECIAAIKVRFADGSIGRLFRDGTRS